LTVARLTVAAPVLREQSTSRQHEYCDQVPFHCFLLFRLLLPRQFTPLKNARTAPNLETIANTALTQIALWQDLVTKHHGGGFRPFYFRGLNPAKPFRPLMFTITFTLRLTRTFLVPRTNSNLRIAVLPEYRNSSFEGTSSQARLLLPVDT
jgi:hypothetical protein